MKLVLTSIMIYNILSQLLEKERQREFGLVLYGLVWFEATSKFGLVWFGFIWYGIIWSGLRQHQSTATGPKNNQCGVNF